MRNPLIRDGIFSMVERSDDKLALPDQSTIVLVEDNPTDVMLFREALQWHGVNPTLLVLRDGDEAIRFLDRIEDGEVPCPDMIVLDINLPEKAVLKFWPGSAQVKNAQKNRWWS